jgi:hypothetical protein
MRRCNHVGDVNHGCSRPRNHIIPLHEWLCLPSNAEDCHKYPDFVKVKAVIDLLLAPHDM